MVKLLVFAILLASSPATGLLETLFRAENICYTDCDRDYGTNQIQLDACKKGCDIGLQQGDCATQCKPYADADSFKSCQSGCNSRVRETGEVAIDKPIFPIASFPLDKIGETVSSSDVEPERPRSLIIIRIRQRPSLDMPQPENIFNNDPIQFFNSIIKQFQDKANGFGENLKELPKPEFPTLSELTKNIPIIRLPGNIRADSSSESSEETNDRNRLFNEFKDAIKHSREQVQPVKNRVQQFFTDVRGEWNDLVRKQPKIPIWIFLCIVLSSSAILWYMVMSLCRHTPSRNALSIRAQELVFHPYEYDAYEKEKIQPDDQPYNVTEPLPIKVKLSNI